MNYLEVYYITRDELMQLAERYPTTYARIRRYAVFMALRREIIQLANKKLEEDAKAAEGLGKVAVVALNRKKTVTNMDAMLSRVETSPGNLSKRAPGMKTPIDEGTVGGLPTGDSAEIVVLRYEVRDLKRLFDKKLGAQRKENHRLMDAVADLKAEAATTSAAAARRATLSVPHDVPLAAYRLCVAQGPLVCCCRAT